MKIRTTFAIWFLALTVLFCVVSCDKIEGDFLEPVTVGNVDTSSGIVIRKILVEDFTGHTCGNCPRAAETAATLKQLYGEQIVIVAVHMGWFAQTQSNPDGSYAYDFTTTMGDEIDASFSIDPTGLPKGMVNRIEGSPGQVLMSYAAWGSAVQALISLPPDMDIRIANTYDTGSRTVTAEITSEFIGNFSVSDTFNLVVVLTEDNVINWQKDYDLPAGQQDIEFYVHPHVLRNSFTGTWGDEIANGSVATGTAVTNTYSMVLPSEWDENKCAIVAYVYETSSKEILQAEESKVK